VNKTKKNNKIENRNEKMINKKKEEEKFSIKENV
jgi:hypothetical protein